MHKIANSQLPVLRYSYGPATLALVVGVALAVGLGVGFALGSLVSAKRSVIILRDVGAQEVSARDRFLACSVAQSEVNLDELAARKRYRCYCVVMSRTGPRPGHLDTGR